jgi:hypothetical protein
MHRTGSSRRGPRRIALAAAALAVAAALGGAPVRQAHGSFTPPAIPEWGYVPLNPQRVLDTRHDLGASGPIGPGQTVELQLAGVTGVPDDAPAIVLNITATQPTAATFVTVWPASEPRPDVSNLNVAAGQTAPNLVIAVVDSNGKVALYNDSGTVHLLADVQGYFTGGSGYAPLVPERVLDTRRGFGADEPVGAGLSITFDALPPSSLKRPASAVVLNVTATGPTAPTFITAWPPGQPRPEASNLNVVAGQTVPNLVIAKVDEHGRVSLYNDAGDVDLIADAQGWFVASTSGYQPMVPERLLDTRRGLGGAGPLGPQSTIELSVLGATGIVPEWAGAVVLNVTATNATATTYVTAWPAGQPRPTASNLNVAAGATVPNLVIAKVGADGKVALYNEAGTTDLIADIAGWFPVTKVEPAS